MCAQVGHQYRISLYCAGGGGREQLRASKARPRCHTSFGISRDLRAGLALERVSSSIDIMLPKGRRYFPLKIPNRPVTHARHIFRRYESNSAKPPQTNQPSVYEDNYGRHPLFVLDVFKRVIKFAAIGIALTVVTTVTVFEGTHMWIENVGMAAESDEEVRKWEWDLEAERWSGGLKGGTDPALGFTGRHAVRSAWVADHWGIGLNAADVASYATTRVGPIVDPRLEFAQDYLTVALRHAQAQYSTGKLRPETFSELLSRHAGMMERMGTKDALFVARADLEQVWAGLPGKGVDAARVAAKIGDLNSRLGDSGDALAWWSRAIHLTKNDDEKSIPTEIPVVPDSPPSSPLAQRTLASILVSLSAYYAKSGQLHQARAVEEAGLNVLRSIRPPESPDSATPPEALHALYVLHRSSLISIHLAEVLYALHTKPPTSIDWLRRAAESSERVALALTGLPRIHPDAPNSQIPHPPSSETPLLADYTKSRSMAQPAQSLLRDARRTAAEAWNLMGILSEGSGADRAAAEKALEYYERALGWAGVAADSAGGIGRAGEGTLEAEWKLLWGNYVRVRDVVRAQNDA